MVLAKHLDEPVYYDTEQLEAIDSHIKTYFGEAKTIIHEFFSEDIHVDIFVIEPNDTHDYYTLVTTGMGSCAMEIPEEYSSNMPPQRAELIICLPTTWNADDKASWEVGLLRYLARFPIVEHTWLAYGHTIGNGTPYTDNTKLTGCILLGIQDAPDGAASCQLPSGETLVFYQVIPLTDDELQYKVEYGTDAMLSRLDDVDHVVDVGRKSTRFGK